MGLFRKSLAISFKEKSIFRFDYLVGTGLRRRLSHEKNINRAKA